MEAAARVFAAGVRNELVGETAARRDGRPRGCHCPQCGQVNHKLGEQLGLPGSVPLTGRGGCLLAART